MARYRAAPSADVGALLRLVQFSQPSGPRATEQEEGLMSVQMEDQGGVLPIFSDQLAEAVERAGLSIVRVDARRRQAASGVAWAAEGVILTADHVLEREEDLGVALPDGRTVSAKIVGRDPGTDIALLKVEGASLTPIEQGPTPKVGHLGLIVAR